MNLIPEIDWTIAALHIRDMLIAFILAVAIGWDREKQERSAGLHTFALVAVAACGCGSEIVYYPYCGEAGVISSECTSTSSTAF